MNMDVYVNNVKITLLQGMTVRHALKRAGFSDSQLKASTVTDEWGNCVGLSGAMAESTKIFICRNPSESSSAGGLS